MINKITAKNILEKILSSKEFVSSTIDQEFLKFLVNTSLKGKTVKETTIAFAVFNKKDFNPAEDSSVRTHIYNLRKKLELYYLKEGKDDKYRLVIPKGQYKIEFINGSSNQKTKNKKKQSLAYIITTLAVIFAAIALYFGYRTFFLEKQLKSLNAIDTNNPIWSDFIKSDLPTMIVIGDYYVFQEPISKKDRERFIRDVEINSDKDLERYLEQNPGEKDKISKTNTTYLGEEVPNCIWYLSNLFQGTGKSVKIKLASNIQFEDLQQNNIIFIGHFKNIRIFNYFFDDLRFKVQLFPHKIFYTPNHSDTLETISLVSYYRYGFHDDFAIVAKVPGGNNNIIMLITSFSAFGKIEATRELVEPTLINDLLDRKIISQKSSPFYFEAMYKIHGVVKTGFRRDILHFHEIDPDKMLEQRSKRLNQAASEQK